MNTASRQTKIRLAIVFALVLFAVLSFYFFDNSLFSKLLREAFAVSPFFGYALFIAAGSLRGFTLLPSTILIIVGVFFFPPLILFGLIMTTVIISSSLLYFVAQKAHLDTLISEKHRPTVERVRVLLQTQELPIITGLSFFPFFPTDILCYTCGSLNINYPKFILGIIIGEGVCCGLYIFLGSSILKSFLIF